jgi:hypothetical protein
MFTTAEKHLFPLSKFNMARQPSFARTSPGNWGVSFWIRKSASTAYFGLMSSTVEFCLPTTGTSVPAGPEWFHEII